MLVAALEKAEEGLYWDKIDPHDVVILRLHKNVDENTDLLTKILPKAQYQALWEDHINLVVNARQPIPLWKVEAGHF